MSLDQITLAVLAGGMGTRLGRPKSSLIIDGAPVLSHLIQRLKWPGPTLLVTAPSNRSPSGFEAFTAEATDPADGAGPVQGMQTALASASTPVTVFVPVDMPALALEQIAELCDVLNHNPAAQGIMCVRNHGDALITEPFPCVLRSTALPAIQQYWNSGRRSLHGLRDAGICGTHNVDHWPADSWINLNTPEELAAWLTGRQKPM
jgi:molybdopterin-guanine dinucleotide biosynthesis protein A